MVRLIKKMFLGFKSVCPIVRVHDPCVQVCAPNKVKKLNVNVSNLLSGVKETRFLVQHKSFEYKYGLNESACNSKQNWNYDECPCECKQLDEWSSCKDHYMCNPSRCDCEFYEACKIDRHLDIKNCSCEKLVNQYCNVKMKNYIQLKLHLMIKKQHAKKMSYLSAFHYYCRFYWL